MQPEMKPWATATGLRANRTTKAARIVWNCGISGNSLHRAMQVNGMTDAAGPIAVSSASLMDNPQYVIDQPAPPMNETDNLRSRSVFWVVRPWINCCATVLVMCFLTSFHSRSSSINVSGIDRLEMDELRVRVFYAVLSTTAPRKLLTHTFICQQYNLISVKK